MNALTQERQKGLPRRHEEHEGIHEEEGCERFAREAVDAGLMVHRRLGPGLLESVYETCLTHELEMRGLPIRRQVALPVIYDGIALEAAYRLDLVIGDSVIIEIKAVEELTKLHTAQLLTYLKLSGMRIGLLMNFNVTLFKLGVKRLVL